MNFSSTLVALSAYVEQSFKDQEPPLPYHNLEHTRAVLEAANEISEHYKLSEEDRFIISSAAWFHDFGISKEHTTNREQRSAGLAEAWLSAQGVPQSIIEKIKKCILATQLPSHPETLNEKILCDADLWNIGTDQFTENQKKNRQEIEWIEGRELDPVAWRNQNIELLSSHQYHTDYARNLLQAKKEENLNKLKAKQEKKLLEEPGKGKGKKKKNKKEVDPNIPTRGIETMFKVTIHNHLELSSMADSKANIMISVNSIIVSVVLSVLVRRLEEFPNMIIPTCILLSVNVMTIVSAILAVRPKILKGKPPAVEEPNKRANLLFFGDFNKMNLKVYTHKMKEMMRDKDYLYENMINNIYFMGIVLVKKYQWLRLAYNVFMYGFIIAVLAFGIAAFF